jgi:chromosome partitioning protein
MRVVALVNQKGGCGKTTTAVHLASRFAALGQRTVLIDLDPQGHSTLGFGVPAPTRDRSLAAVLAFSGLDEHAVPLREILIDVVERLRVAPTSAELAELEPDLAGRPGAEERLAEHLAPLIPEVDRVVIDAPPSLGILTLNALMACHDAVVPVEPSLFSLHGLARLSELVKLLAGQSRHPVRLRVLLNAFDRRTRFAREVRDEIRRTFPGQTLQTVVRNSVRVREAAARGVPVDRLTPRAPIVGDYDALAAELEAVHEAERAAPRPATVQGLRVTRHGVYLTRNDVPPERVRLAGDFNDWVPDGGVVLEVHDDGCWTKFLPLEPGRYEYKLIVDGRWQPDPLNPVQAPNRLGSTNSVLEIDR